MTTQTPIKPTNSKPRRRRDFDAMPEYLPEACEFSDDPTLTDPISVLRLVRKHLTGGAPGTIGDLWDRTSAKLDCSQKEGRNRKVGDWGLLYTTGFVLGRQAEMVSFWDNQLWSPLWAEAGFEEGEDGTHRRSFSTMWRRFGEMESDDCVEALEDAADELFALARSKNPRIGRDVYVDAVSTHSRGALHHDCPDKKVCRAKRRAAQRLKNASPEEVKEARKEEALKPPKVIDEERKNDPKPSAPLKGDKYKHYVWVGEHRYGTHDPDVGVRAYIKDGKVKKVWVGGLDVVATDGETGGTMRNLHAPANQQEYNLYEPLMQRVFKTLQGEMPEAVAGDRGYSVEKVFRSNTERGIASVFAFRTPHASIKRPDLRNLAFDEHGVGRCPHCGGPGAQIPGVSFRESGSPRIRFTCADPGTVECLSASWSLNPGDHRQGWRLLVPLSRLSPRYHAMRTPSTSRRLSLIAVSVTGPTAQTRPGS